MFPAHLNPKPVVPTMLPANSTSAKWSDVVLANFALEMVKVRHIEHLILSKNEEFLLLQQRVLPGHPVKAPTARAYWYDKINPFFVVLEKEHLAKVRQEKVEAFTEVKALEQAKALPEYTAVEAAVKVEVAKLKSWLSDEIAKAFNLNSAVIDNRLKSLYNKVEDLSLLVTSTTPDVLTLEKLSPVTFKWLDDKNDPCKALVYGSNLSVHGPVPEHSPEHLVKAFPNVSFDFVGQPDEHFHTKCTEADVIFYNRRLTSDKIFNIIKTSKKPNTRAIDIPNDYHKIRDIIRDFLRDPVGPTLARS